MSKYKEIKLEKKDYLSSNEKVDWQEGVFIGNEDSNFFIDLPLEYNYNQDFRLYNTKSFVIKKNNFLFTIVGQDVDKIFNLHEDSDNNFKNSIDEYINKAFAFLISNKIDDPKNLKLYKIISGDKQWYRATYSYELNNKTAFGGYNFLGKVWIKIFASKALNRVGYNQDKRFQEYKIVDFFTFKVGNNAKYFALVYSFDSISTKSTVKMLKIINEISKSLNYYK